jgi:hypothetical protein
MKVRTYHPPNQYNEKMAGYESLPDHQWFIDVDGDEYLELVKWLKGMAWKGKVTWFPRYFPGNTFQQVNLEMQIIASDDRDATLIKLSL